jgi:hypothetical protein
LLVYVRFSFGGGGSLKQGTIQIGKNVVTKTSSPERMFIEVEKTIRACEIGKRSGLFSVPAVLEYDKINGVAVFEKIDKLSPIATILKVSENYSSVIKQLGKALAVIHRELKLPPEMISELPGEFRSEGTDVFLHGDFNGINVCVIPQAPFITIIDWQMTSKHGGEATYGSRYFDLLWFINYLLQMPEYYFPFKSPVNKVAELLFQSYFLEADLSYDAESVTRYAREFFKAKMSEIRMNPDSRRDRFLMPFTRMHVQGFLRSLNLILADTYSK